MYITYSFFSVHLGYFSHLSCFSLFAIVKNAVLNISVQVLVGVSASASFGKYIEIELLDYMIIQCSRF